MRLSINESGNGEKIDDGVLFVEEKSHRGGDSEKSSRFSGNGNWENKDREMDVKN